MTFAFFYGSLRNNHHNHYIVEKSEFVGKATTCEKYVIIVDESDKTTPYLSTNHRLYKVRGEVYNLDEKTMKEVDYLEGIDIGWYSKLLIKVDIEGDIRIVYAYMNNNSPGEIYKEFDQNEPVWYLQTK